MGWNGSDRKGTAPAQPKVTAKKPSPVRGLIAGLVVVLAAAVCYFAFFSKSEKPAAKKVEKKPTVIKTVKPAVAPEVLDESVATNRPLSRREERERRGVFTNKFGYVYNLPPTKHVTTNDVGALTSASLSAKVFTNPADRKIGRLFEITPGQMIVGTLPKGYYGAAFERNFYKSIQEPIIVSESDSPAVKSLKKAVINAKIELMDRVRAGESLESVMTAARNELQQTWLYREDLRKEVERHVKKADLSKEDIEDFITAANKMLAERGAKPLKTPRIALSKMIMAEEKKQAEQSGANEKKDEAK